MAFFCRKVDLVGHSVESERNRSDVPRHDIAAQVADGRLEAKPSRVLSYKDIREAHHILEEAAEADPRCELKNAATSTVAMKRHVPSSTSNSIFTRSIALDAAMAAWTRPAMG